MFCNRQKLYRKSQMFRKIDGVSIYSIRHKQMECNKLHRTVTFDTKCNYYLNYYSLLILETEIIIMCKYDI